MKISKRQRKKLKEKRLKKASLKRDFLQKKFSKLVEKIMNDMKNSTDKHLEEVSHVAESMQPASSSADN
jgi:hypothetical protein